jgi:hypothetical protein
MLRRGSTGEDVRRLQIRLNDFGNYGLVIDGIFGPLTENAVRDFQSRAGIRVDGIAGPETLARIGLNTTSGSGDTTFVFNPNAQNPAPTNQPTATGNTGATGTSNTTSGNTGMNTLAKAALGLGAIVGVGYMLNKESKPKRTRKAKAGKSTTKRKAKPAPKRRKPAKRRTAVKKKVTKRSKLTVSRPSANTVIVRKNQQV